MWQRRAAGGWWMLAPYRVATTCLSADERASRAMLTEWSNMRNSMLLLLLLFSSPLQLECPETLNSPRYSGTRFIYWKECENTDPTRWFLTRIPSILLCSLSRRREYTYTYEGGWLRREESISIASESMLVWAKRRAARNLFLQSSSYVYTIRTS